ncbi:alpha-tectorin-like, partial [Carcharodon carcharias]|uniref:alpha-tectorin-like n=1 Tax=Carcharodon carcharias TaxID=13397 RepID=UPI001B7F2271
YPCTCATCCRESDTTLGSVAIAKVFEAIDILLRAAMKEPKMRFILMCYEDHFYPFGREAGDVANPKLDDGGSPEIDISTNFPFFETSHNSLYVNNNGVVSFGSRVSQYTPNTFPLLDGRAFIAPFWGDVDNRISGTIYYRDTRDASLLRRATADINKYAPGLSFEAQWVFVATWDRVAFYGSQTSKVNSFQAVLITDGFQSFIILNYGDIQWTTGLASGGNARTGLGGTAAQAGFNSGGSKHYFSIPGSQTPGMVDIESTSNVQEPGRWVFRTDTFRVIGGCIYRGTFIRKDDTFWTNSTCETKCKCVLNNSLECQPAACAPDELCLSSASFYSCKPMAVQTCTIFGDPHYHTFDGKLFHFQGTCTYILSQLCRADGPLHFYRVEAKNENRGNRAVSWVRHVRLVVYGSEITMINGATDHILLNGTRTSLPIVIGSGLIRIAPSGFTIMASTDFGLRVNFDGSHHVTISLPASYHNATCGLCANMNGDLSDEFQLPNGMLTASEVEFGKSWKVIEDGQLCADECGSECRVCTGEQAALYSGPDHCGIIGSQSGPFNICHSGVQPQDFIQSCAYDLCADGGSVSSLCKALSTYSARCRLQGVPSIVWRRPGLCEMSCPPHSHYEPCSSACPATCADTIAPFYCTRPCVESCECDDGYILSGGRCVALSQCGCSFQGHYYSRGETVILTESCSRKCTCWNTTTGLSCEDFRCGVHEDCRLVDGVRGCYPKADATCWAAGDPHYSTFDGTAFDFQGSSKYTFSRYCGASGNLTMFNVEVEKDHRGSRAVSWTRLVEVQVYGHQIQMLRGQTGKVQVNGEVFNLPVRLESGKIHLFQSGSAAVLQTGFGLRLSYDWNHLAVLTVPRVYSGSLCGLCGNFNGDGADDFVSPNGTAFTAASAFGNSWRTAASGAGSEDPPEPQVPLCTEADRSVYASESQCGVLREASGPFRQCHSVLSPTTAFENCVFDLCALAGDPGTLCQAIEPYAWDCQRRAIAIGDWRNRTRCEMSCPPHSHYEPCSSACPATCADTIAPFYCTRPCVESCECDDGYILSGGRCVALSQCGCSFQGHYYSRGETVILTESCSRKCTCWNTTTGLSCEDFRCGVHEDCRLVDGVRGCYPKADATCWAAGDPHYSTFDGTAFDFQGSSKYTFSRYCGASGNLTMFNVEVENDHRGSRAVSWTRLVEVQVYGHQIQMLRGQTGKVQVNGEAFNLPVRLESGKIHLFQSGSAAVLQTGFGLRLSYDWNHLAVLTVPRVYSGSLCGLCGNFNGDGADDFVSPNGTAFTAASAFGNSWRTAASGAGSEDPPEPQVPLCTEADRSVYASESQCGVLSEASGPFRQCHSVLSPTTAFENCVFDLCALAGEPGTLCHAIEPYAWDCQRRAIAIGDWRNRTRCEMSCPPHSHYEPCSSACPATCADTIAPFSCTRPCVESCECDDGYILSGGRCVALSQCGCSFQGHYYSRGETVILTESCSRKCTCWNTTTGLSCEDFRCGVHEDCRLVDGVRGCYPKADATCWAAGDPHYSTFDGTAFDFQGSSKYTFSRYCGASGNLTMFNVEVEKDHRGSRAVYWTRLVEVQVYGHQIQMLRGQTGKVQVNGEAFNLPVRLESGKIHLFQSGSAAVLQTGFGLRLSYDWNHLAVLTIPRVYSGSLCGLCGNFNGDGADDFVSPNGTAFTAASAFGNSWRTAASGAGSEDPPEPQVPLCTEADRSVYASESHCGLLSEASGPFRQCHSVLSPTTAFENCVFDLCALAGDPGTLCHAIEPYAWDCQRRGIAIGDWRNRTRCGNEICLQTSTE